MAPHTVFRFTFRCILSSLILITIFFRIPDTVLWSFSLIVSAFSNAPDPKCGCGPSGRVNGSHEVEKEKHDLYELELEAGRRGRYGVGVIGVGAPMGGERDERRGCSETTERFC